MEKFSPANAGAYAPLFAEDIRPHDSLGDRGFAIFVAVILTGACAIGLVLALAGYTPIALFLIGDIGLLAGAGRLFRRSRRRMERVVIRDGSVVISRFVGERLVDQRRLAVFGLALEREDDPDFGCQRTSLVLRGVRHDVGRDLAPAQRDAFARRLAAALADAGGASTVRRIERPGLLSGEPSYAR